MIRGAKSFPRSQGKSFELSLYDIDGFAKQVDRRVSLFPGLRSTPAGSDCAIFDSASASPQVKVPSTIAKMNGSDIKPVRSSTNFQYVPSMPKNNTLNSQDVSQLKTAVVTA